MFKAGIVHGIIILIATSLVILIRFETLQFLLTSLTIVGGGLILGYLYKRKFGRISFNDKKSTDKLGKYLGGIGVIWGPANLYMQGFPSPEMNVISTILLLIVSVPMMGASFVTLILIGGFFYNDKT